MISNVVQVVLNETDQYFETQPVFAKNRGNYLEFTGVDLPDYFEVHFAKEETGTSIRDIAENHLVRIPDELLLTGDQIYAWIYLHTTGEDGETMCAIRIPVNRRADITNVEPEPVQHDIIEQAIAALQNGIEDVQEIETGIPEMVDNLLDEAKSSGEFDGPPGFSPTVDVTNIPGGHRVVISDAEGDHIFSVMDGRDGGAAELIDDQAGAGDLSKTWSANKTTEELSTKADINNPEFTGKFSHGRSSTASKGYNSFTYGQANEASGQRSFAFGYYNIAKGEDSFVHGERVSGIGRYVNVFGKSNVEDDPYDIPEWVSGRLYQKGEIVKNSNLMIVGETPQICIFRCKTRNSDVTFTNSNWEMIHFDPSVELSPYVEIVGNGLNPSNRSNARTLDWAGNERLMGNVYVNCNADSTGGTKLAKLTDIPAVATTTETQAIITEYGVSA